MKQRRATLFGLPNSPEAYELRDFLKRSGFPFEWIDLKTDDDARRLAGVTGLDDPRLPVCVMEKGSVLFRPTIRDLAAALDWFRGPKHERYDLAIYGAGPAALSAAVYGASEGLRTIVLERSAVGGQAGSTSRIDNYLGFPDGISGWELASRARQQAQRLGAEIIVTAEGVGGETRDGWTVSWLSEGQEIVARATICASVVLPRPGGPTNNTWSSASFRFRAASMKIDRLARACAWPTNSDSSCGRSAVSPTSSTRRSGVTMREGVLMGEACQIAC